MENMMSSVKKYAEKINVKSRETAKLTRCSEFKIERGYGDVYVTKEKILNEFYCSNGNLNKYIHSITHSVVCYNGSPRKGEEIVYFTDTKNISREIVLPGICQMMRNNANIEVSSEGILLFFDENQIVATLDCIGERIAGSEQIDNRLKKINFVVANNYETFVNYDVEEKTLKSLNIKVTSKKNIVFEFDFTAQISDCAINLFFK